MEETLPDFANKVVYVFFAGGAPHARTAVQNPRFERQGGELFLVGRGLLSKEWGSDVPVGIAWSKIQWYSVFESPDAFYEAATYYKKKRTKIGLWR